MASSYPGALDALSNPASTDLMTAPSHSGQHADANDAIEAIQATLGVDPQGALADVAARLAALEAAGGGWPLVVPTSIANSGGSASLTGGKVTFTGVNSISVNGCFTSAYDNYRVVIVAGAPSASDRVLMRLRASGTDNSASVYNEGGAIAGGGGGGSWSNLNSANHWDIYEGLSGTVAGMVSCDVCNPAVAINTQMTGTNVVPGGGPVPYGGYFGGWHASATAFDGFTVYPNSGTASGIIRVYGYQNS